MGKELCIFCTHYGVCRFKEALFEFRDNILFLALKTDAKVINWIWHFAKLCDYFELDEPEYEGAIKVGMEFLFDQSIRSDKLGSIYSDGEQHCDESCPHCNPEPHRCEKHDQEIKPYQTCIEVTQDKHKKR